MHSCIWSAEQPANFLPAEFEIKHQCGGCRCPLCITAAAFGDGMRLAYNGLGSCLLIK